jgi:hypothetical protein
MSSPSAPAVTALPVAPRRRRRWRAIVAVLLLLLVAAWFFVLPPVAKSVLASQLRGLGWRDVAIGAVDVAFDGVVVRDLRGALPGLVEVHVPTTTANVRLGDLLSLRFDTLTLEGARVRMLDGPRESLPASATTAARALPDLPLRRLELRAAEIALPAAAGGEGGETVRLDARLTRAGAMWDLVTIAAFAGTSVQCTARCRDEGATAHGPVSIVFAGETPLMFGGELRLAMAAGDRTVHASLDRAAGAFAFAIGEAAVRGDGGLALAATVPFADLAASTFTVRADDLRIESGEARVDGIRGEVALAGWPVTAPAQRVQWQGARFAAITGGSGSAVLELRSGFEVLAELKQHAAGDDGSITLQQLRYAPGAERVPAHVVIERLPLREWLEMLSKGRVTGDGRIGGELDVAVTMAPRFDLEVTGGHVAAEPGGVVRFLEDAETEAMIREHAREVAAASEHRELVQERIVGALKKFSFDALDFRIVRSAAGESTLQVHAAGKGLDVPQVLDLTVNLHGFDAALDTALALKLGLDRARDVGRAPPPASPDPSRPKGQRNQ